MVGAHPCFPSFCPSPWLLLWSSCHSQPPCPRGSLPSACLAYAFNYQECRTHFSPGAGTEGAKMDKRKGREALPATPTPRIHITMPRIPLSSSSFVPSPTSVLQVSGLHGGRAGGAVGPVPEQASARHGSEATAPCPPASYLTGVAFRDSLRQRIKILPQLRN